MDAVFLTFTNSFPHDYDLKLILMYQSEGYDGILKHHLNIMKL